METDRLIIRRFKPEDWEDLYEYLSQEEVVKYEPYPVHTAEESREEAKRRVTDNSFWAVCLKETGKLIGNIYLAPGAFDTWELGYVFNENHQKKGYATEAARFLVNYVFQVHNARRIVARCNPLNTPSWRLMERLGMRREGHLHQNIYFKKDAQGNPIWADTYEYAVLAPEWRE